MIHVFLFVNVYVMCTEVFLAPESLGCLPSTVLSPINTQRQVQGGVCGGEGEGECNVRCIIYWFSSMSMLCARFPVTFQRLRKKATKQCNGEKDLQHSTIELKEAWRMKQMPRLTLTIPSLATYLCSLVCRSHVHETGNTTAYQGFYITWAPHNYMGDILCWIRTHPPHPIFTGISFICQV